MEVHNIVDNDSEAFMAEISRARTYDQNPMIACNYYNVIADMLVTISQMQTKINVLESRIYTLEGLVK